MEWNTQQSTCHGMSRTASSFYCLYYMSVIVNLGWTLYKSAKLEGLVLSHLCSNKYCFNPDHLIFETIFESIRTLPQMHNESDASILEDTINAEDGLLADVCKLIKYFLILLILFNLIKYSIVDEITFRCIQFSGDHD